MSWTHAQRQHVKRLLLVPPFEERMSGWAAGQLARAPADAETANELWCDFWEERFSQAIDAFAGGPDFPEHVRVWSSSVEGRILCISARQWTALEREMVLRWLFSDRLLAWQKMTVRRNGVPAADAADTVHGFWVTQGFDLDKGVLTNYSHTGTSDGCAGHFLGFVKTALSRYCWAVARARAEDRQRLAPLNPPGQRP